MKEAAQAVMPRADSLAPQGAAKGAAYFLRLKTSKACSNCSSSFSVLGEEDDEGGALGVGWGGSFLVFLVGWSAGGGVGGVGAGGGVMW